MEICNQTQKEQKDLNFTILSFFIQDLLGSTEKRIRKMFPSTSLKNDKKYECLELCREDITVLCIFSNKVCKQCLLFFDDDYFFDLYCEICDEVCKTTGTNQWKSENMNIELIGKGKNACFYFHL